MVADTVPIVTGTPVSFCIVSSAMPAKQAFAADGAKSPGIKRTNHRGVCGDGLCLGQ